MLKHITNRLESLFRRRGEYVPVRVRNLFTIAVLGMALAVVSPTDVLAQRGSTSKGKTERSERSSSRSVKKSNDRSSKARSSRATRTESRVNTAKSVGRAIQSARNSVKRGNSRSSDTRRTNSGAVRNQDARTSGNRSSGTRSSDSRGSDNRGTRSSGTRSSDSRNSDSRSVRDQDNRRVGNDSNRNRSSATRANRPVTSGRTGARVLDRSDNGRVAAARGASRTSRDRNIVIDGRRARLTLPGVRANWRSYGDRHVRFRTRIHVTPKRYYRPHNRISVHIAWPWKVRYHRHWSPRYRYRQVVIVRSDWDRSHRASRIEMETTYRHKVRFATDQYAVLDIDIEQVALYDNGRYFGMVDRIPAHLSSVEATVFRNGDIAFDRDIFLVGDRRSGFEIISTPFYDGYAGQGYRYGDDMRVGQVDLRRNRVRTKGYSRLFDPRRWQGFTPISLLPEDDGWLWDFGADAISAAYDDYDAYYGFGAGLSGRYQSRDAYEAQSNYAYETAFGAQFNVERTASIRRVE